MHFLLKKLTLPHWSSHFVGAAKRGSNASLSAEDLCMMHGQGKPVPFPPYLFGIRRARIVIAKVLELGNLMSTLHSANTNRIDRGKFFYFIKFLSTQLQNGVNRRHCQEAWVPKRVNICRLCSDVATRGQACPVCGFPSSRCMSEDKEWLSVRLTLSQTLVIP